MNHDETNSNSDAKPESQPGIDPALEARVVAWVAGEASAFESAELERLIAAQPELAIFKRRIEAVHGLVSEALRPDPAPVVMSAERRAKLLQSIGVTAEGDAVAGGKVVAMKQPERRSRWSWRGPQIYFTLAGAAAAGLVALFVVTGGEGPYRMKRAVARAAFEKEAIQRERAVKAEAEAKLRASSNDREVSLKERDASGTVSFAPGQQPAPPPPSKPVAVDLLARADRVAAPPTLADKAKVSFGGVVANEEASAGRSSDEAKRQLFREEQGQARVSFDSVPRRPAPSSTVIGPAGVGGAVAGDETRRAGARGAPATPPAEGVIKLEAFTVSAPRDMGYAAASNSISAAANKQVMSPPPAFDDRLKDGLDKKTPIIGDGRVAANSGVVLGAASVGGNLRTVNGGVRVAELSTLNEKNSAVAFIPPAGLESSGVKAAAKSDSADLPLARPAVAGKDLDESLRAEIATSVQSESTFSLHVSDVSFRLAQAALARGEMPDADRIRPEEFYNAFNYGDPSPTMAEKVGARIEQAAHPFLQQRNLVRIAVRVPATGRGAAQSLRLTILLDTSGSMEREDRAATVRRALQELIALLGPNDRVTLIGFARQPRLLAEAVAGNQAGWLVELAARTPAEGGTNLEAALKLGGELAQRHASPGAQNRIVVLTDGAANLGNADPDQLAKAIEALRQQGIAFDACGIGLDGLDDAVLEALTRRGDGRYHVLNSPDEAGAGFARQLAGAFRPAAENVKLQVRFNVARVSRYRLIGFEQHRLRSEDFRNDRVDAAELAAEEAAVALYQVEVLPEGAGELGEVSVRFRDAATGQMVERTWALPYEPAAPAFDRATPSLQLAGTAALLAEKLRGGALAEPIKLRDLSPIVNALRGSYANEPRVQEFVTMFAQARRRLGE